MTRSGRYARLDPDSVDAADVCPVHLLLNMPRIVAEIDAVAMRKDASLGTQPSLARAERCAESAGDVWHIYLPRKTQMKGIRKKLRQQGLLPSVDS